MRPPGKADERRWRLLFRQALHLLELGLRLLLTAQGAPQPAQTVMSIRLGRVDPDRLAKMVGSLFGIVPCGQKNPKIQVRKPEGLIQSQRAPKVRLRSLCTVRMHFRVAQIGQGLRVLRLTAVSSASNSRQASSYLRCFQ